MNKNQKSIMNSYNNGILEEGDCLDCLLETIEKSHPTLHKKVMNSTDCSLESCMTDEQCIDGIFDTLKGN